MITMDVGGESVEAEQAQKRRVIISRYARLFPNGTPAFCTPSQIEIHVPEARFQSPRTDGKVIYPNRAAAEAAATELMALRGGRLRVYECGRSRHGHCHITTELGRH